MMQDPSHRSAVIDLGSNSIRMVVFEGRGRNPTIIFNEKSVVKLGKGMQITSRLSEESMCVARRVLARFYIIGRGMQANPFEILATAAVRDAQNGIEFIAELRKIMPDIPIRILSGEEEADFSARGVLSSLPLANGIVADIGGGSLELIQIKKGERKESTSLRLGVIRLSDRSKNSLLKAQIISGEDIKTVTWMKAAKGKTLYLVGGAFLGLARLNMKRRVYPFHIIHLYTVPAADLMAVAEWVINSSRRDWEQIDGLSRKRLDDLPFAACVLKAILKKFRPERIVFSATGLREGWYMTNIAAAVKDQSPWEAAAKSLCRMLGRNQILPLVLFNWTNSLFSEENKTTNRLRRIACWMSDIGSLDHAEYRAEQTYHKVLYLSSNAFDHHAKAFLAMTLAVRYDISPDMPDMAISRRLLSELDIINAVKLGQALRLGYTISGGVESLLEGTSLTIDNKNLVLSLMESQASVCSDLVIRRLNQLAATFGLSATIQKSKDLMITES